MILKASATEQVNLKGWSLFSKLPLKGAHVCKQLRNAGMWSGYAVFGHMLRCDW